MENLKETIKQKLIELSKSIHSIDRLKSRLESIKGEITPSHFNIVINSLAVIKDIDFPKEKSYAINLGPLTPIKGSKYSIEVSGRVYLSITGLEDGTLKDSTGNQFWVVIRNNTIITAFLRKDIQTKDVNKNRSKLNVDKVFNRVSHIKSL